MEFSNDFLENFLSNRPIFNDLNEINIDNELNDNDFEFCDLLDDDFKENLVIKDNLKENSIIENDLKENFKEFKLNQYELINEENNREELNNKIKILFNLIRNSTKNDDKYSNEDQLIINLLDNTIDEVEEIKINKYFVYVIQLSENNKWYIGKGTFIRPFDHIILSFLLIKYKHINGNDHLNTIKNEILNPNGSIKLVILDKNLSESKALTIETILLSSFNTDKLTNINKTSINLNKLNLKNDEINKLKIIYKNKLIDKLNSSNNLDLKIFMEINNLINFKNKLLDLNQLERATFKLIYHTELRAFGNLIDNYDFLVSLIKLSGEKNKSIKIQVVKKFLIKLTNKVIDYNGLNGFITFIRKELFDYKFNKFEWSKEDNDIIFNYLNLKFQNNDNHLYLEDYQEIKKQLKIDCSIEKIYHKLRNERINFQMRLDKSASDFVIFKDSRINLKGFDNVNSILINLFSLNKYKEILNNTNSSPSTPIFNLLKSIFSKNLKKKNYLNDLIELKNLLNDLNQDILKYLIIKLDNELKIDLNSIIKFIEISFNDYDYNRFLNLNNLLVNYDNNDESNEKEILIMKIIRMDDLGNFNDQNVNILPNLIYNNKIYYFNSCSCFINESINNLFNFIFDPNLKSYLYCKFNNQYKYSYEVFRDKTKRSSNLIIFTNDDKFKLINEFSQNTNLIIHLPTISKPINNNQITIQQFKYECTICQYRTNYSASFKDHALTHTGKRNCICTICDKPFGRKKDLKRHIETVHAPRNLISLPLKKNKQQSSTKNDNKQLPLSTNNNLILDDQQPSASGTQKIKQPKVKCYLCTKEFSRTNTLNKHLFSAHKIEPKSKTVDKSLILLNKNHKPKAPLKQYRVYKCEECLYQTLFKSSFNQHLTSHSANHEFKCPKCTFSARQKHRIKQHLKNYH